VTTEANTFLIRKFLSFSVSKRMREGKTRRHLSSFQISLTERGRGTGGGKGGGEGGGRGRDLCPYILEHIDN
jgi:hypothetical protein